MRVLSSPLDLGKANAAASIILMHEHLPFKDMNLDAPPSLCAAFLSPVSRPAINFQSPSGTCLYSSLFLDISDTQQLGDFSHLLVAG